MKVPPLPPEFNVVAMTTDCQQCILSLLHNSGGCATLKELIEHCVTSPSGIRLHASIGTAEDRGKCSRSKFFRHLKGLANEKLVTKRVIALRGMKRGVTQYCLGDELKHKDNSLPGNLF